jgi:hypothetical protein
MKRLISIVATALLGLGLLGVNAAQADRDPFTLLSGYIAQWRGEGVLMGGDAPEPFRCRLSIARGSDAKVNFSGRCNLVDTNISISGTIAYNAAKQQYEAAMSSNAGFTGMAVGRQSQSRITFDLKEKQRDRTGDDVQIGAGIVLADGRITVNFQIEFNNSGDVLTASVPFTKAD